MGSGPWVGAYCTGGARQGTRWWYLVEAVGPGSHSLVEYGGKDECFADLHCLITFDGWKAGQPGSSSGGPLCGWYENTATVSAWQNLKRSA